MTTPLRIGTRGSALALWQAERVRALLAERTGRPGELVKIRTTGDRNRRAPLSQIGGKGVFVKEIEAALVGGEIDLAVHSAKDLPSFLAEETVLAAFPEREDPRDALVVRAPRSGSGLLDALASGARVGTGSLRRGCQLLARRPDLEIADIRGNVDTRLRKLDEGQFDAIVLAAAGLARLERTDRIHRWVDPEAILPGVGQGTLAVQVCRGDLARELRHALDDPALRLRTTAERGFLARFEGDCQVPVAGHAVLEDGRLVLRVRVVSLDGRQVVETRREAALDGTPDGAEGSADEAAAADIGRQAADEVLSAGGAEILREVHQSS